MSHRRPVVAALALAVLLAGCGAVDLSGIGASPSTTADTAPSPTPTATATATPSPTESWIPPEPPNRPTEVVDESGRITRVEVVNGVRSDDGSGYENFDLLVHADTRMPDVDPPEHGTVEGEPYFLVAVEGDLVARTRLVITEEGTFEIEIHPGSLEPYESGTLEVTVSLMDRDTERDDRYGVWTGTVEYDAG